MPALRLLLVEDSDDDALLLASTLRREKLDVDIVRAVTEAEVRAALAQGGLDVVVADWVVPGLSALDVLAMATAADPDLPVLLVSGVLREEDAVQALRSGARDFVVKDRLARLAPAIRREVDAARQRREEHVLRARVAVVERLACVGVLARGLVHDMNGGIAVLASNVEYALETEDRAEGLEALRDARAAAARLTETVESLRAFTSIDAAETTLDLRQVLASAVRLVRVGIGAEVVVEAKPVPPIYASEAVLVQLLYTLLLAAVGEDRSSARRVTIHIDAEGDRVRVRVGPVARKDDDGGALARGVREALCRHLVAELHGELVTQMHDADGATTWTVLLRTAPSVVAALASPVPAEPPTLDETRVLVVDDDPILCRTLARVLWPAKVTIVGNASDALDVIAREGPFDAVLCDLVMEPIDGVRFIELLRRVAPQQAERVAMLTATADRARVERQLPGTTVLSKPFEAEDVRNAVGAISGASTRV